MNRIKDIIKKTYESGAFHITFGTFATKFVAFFGSIVVVRLLNKTDYGVMSYVENIYSYAFILAGLGLSNAILRYMVKAEEIEEKYSYYKYIINQSILRDVFLALIIIVISQVIKFPVNYEEAKYLLPIVAILLPFQDLLNNELYTIRSFFKNKLYAWLAFMSSTLLIIGRVAGAYMDGVNGVLLSRVLINSLFSVVILMLMYRYFFKGVHAERLLKEQRNNVNVYSLQYMVTNGFWAIFMLNDAFFLGQLLNNPDSLADYKVASVLPGNISIFATAIGVYVSPYFTKNENNYNWVRKNFMRVFILTSLIVGVIAFILSFFAEPIIVLMYGEEYLTVINLMRGLLLAAFLNSGIRYTCANTLAAMGEIKYNMIVSGIGIVLQVVLDIFLIPRIGLMAVVISNCVVFLIMGAILLAVFIRKYYWEK